MNFKQLNKMQQFKIKRNCKCNTKLLFLRMKGIFHAPHSAVVVALMPTHLRKLAMPAAAVHAVLVFDVHVGPRVPSGIGITESHLTRGLPLVVLDVVDILITRSGVRITLHISFD